MPFQWNVDPKMWRYEMRETYRHAVFRTGSKVAAQRLPEATAWMRENAPWKDRTPEQRAKRGYTGKNARQSLKAVTEEEFFSTPESRKEEAGRVRTARMQDERTFDNINALRRERGKQPYESVDRLPASIRSKVAQKPKTGPVLTVYFRHGKFLRYTLWLEVANQGRYSIIVPAIRHWGRIFMMDMQRLINLKHVKGQSAGEASGYDKMAVMTNIDD